MPRYFVALMKGKKFGHMYTEYTLGGAATWESQWLKSSTIAKECEVQKLSG